MPLHLHRDIEKLQFKVSRLGDMVEKSLHSSVQAFLTNNSDLAQKAIKTDVEIDELEVEIEEDCLKLLALHKPVAADLRYIISILKLNNDLERIGDLTVKIAKKIMPIEKRDNINADQDLNEMADLVKQMLKTSLDSLINCSESKAQEVLDTDPRVDEINSNLHERVREYYSNNIEQLKPALNILSVARNLERAADHTTNIAEDVIYMVTGKIVRHIEHTD